MPQNRWGKFRDIMKWLVRSDFGLKCNGMMSLVWNYRSGVTVMKYLGWIDLYELISMNDLGRTSWYEKTLGMKWLMVWSDSWYEVVTVWSDTKNEVDIVWSVWAPINESFVFISEWVVYADYQSSWMLEMNDCYCFINLKTEGYTYLMTLIRIWKFVTQYWQTKMK